ncbi:MAG: tetratricopeptide repeat protein [Candidatus Riflebacteria bacterium]|nr:tetratricopeptide repeat protein [Candidatus Riflebacteria bacterium]
MLMVSACLHAETTFLMGEDVVHPSGLVVAVNSLQRRPFASGLGVSRQDEIFVNLTFVNTGVRTYRVDPFKDFALEISSRFEPSLDQENKATRNAFNVFPSTQSRVNLYFKVDSAQVEMPILHFTLEDSSVSILCDSELEKLLQKSADTTLRSSEAVKLGRVLVESMRYSQAESMLSRALAADPNNNQLLMLMASVADGNYDRENASHYLRLINPATIADQEEAYAVAKMAVTLGFYDLAVTVLSPFEMVGRLSSQERLLLARASYYENDLDASTRILDTMIREGSREAAVYFTYANIYDRQGNIEKAIELWEKAIEFSPDHTESHFNLGVGYYKLQRIDKARACWEKVLLLNPDSQTLRATEDALRATEY